MNTTSTPRSNVLIASLVARLGLDVLQRLLAFSLVVILALAVHVAVVLVPLLRVGGRFGVVVPGNPANLRRVGQEHVGVP